MSSSFQVKHNQAVGSPVWNPVIDTTDILFEC